MNGPTWQGRPLWHGDVTSRLHWWARTGDATAFLAAALFPFLGLWPVPPHDNILTLPAALGFTYVVLFRPGRFPS